GPALHCLRGHLAYAGDRPAADQPGRPLLRVTGGDGAPEPARPRALRPRRPPPGRGAVQGAPPRARRGHTAPPPTSWGGAEHERDDMIALIDYDLGNLRSVEKALATVGADVRLTSDPDVILAAEKVVLPGVGAFGDGMVNLRRRGLDEVVQQVVACGTP